jgi:hypothetical protein
MSLWDDYLHSTEEITGGRTKAEEQYDAEVIHWLNKGAQIEKAIEKANQKYPEEALEVDETNVDAVAAHYDYLKEHVELVREIKLLKRKKEGKG